jgi:response regulator RpfG family c-di-GMP phosphodiesterase
VGLVLLVAGLLAAAVDATGLWGLPLVGAVALIAWLPVRRGLQARRTVAQTVDSLARATELAGYTLPGHARRVCATAHAVGRELGLRGPALRTLEQAALMHDVGQLSLVDPVPGGATALLSREERRRIARLGSEVVRQSGVAPEVAAVVAQLGEPAATDAASGAAELPLATRILRVVNDFDDLASDDPGPARRAEVLAQLRRGARQGEYDPRVVAVLARVAEPASPR